MKTAYFTSSCRASLVKVLSAAAALASIFASTSAQAASATWTGTTNGNWTGVTWTGGTAPGGSGTTTNTDVATFASSGAGTVTVDSGRNIGGLTFGGSSAMTLTGGSLVLSNGGALQAISGNTATQTINSSVTLEGDGTIANSSGNSPGNILSLGGGIAEDSGVTGSLTLGGSNTNTGNGISGAIADGASSGILTLAKTGSGKWALTGANTYSGATTIYAGTLTLTGAGGTMANTSSLTVEGGSTLTLGDSADGLVNRLNTAATLTLGGAYNSLDGSSLNGTLSVGKGSATLNSQSLVSLTIAAGTSDNIIEAESPSGTNPTLTFTGANPYVRNTAGFVRMDVSGSVTISFTTAPSGAGNVGGVAGGQLLIGAYQFGNNFIKAQSGVLSQPTETTTVNGVNTASTFANKNMNLGASASSTMSGAISINSLRFNAAGPLTLTLTGANTINAPGILVGSNSSGINTITGGTIATTNAGGELLIYENGANLTINSAIVDNGTSSLSVGGTSTLTLTGANTYAGVTSIASGATLQLGDGTTSGTALAGNVTNYYGGTFNLNLANGGSLASNITSDGTINFTPGSGITQTYSGTISDGGSGVGTLNQTGAGTTILTGSATALGGASVTSGTLKLNGATLTTGPLTVNTGATIGGNGTSHSSTFAINGNVMVGNGTDSTSQTTITGTTASTFTNANLTFNLNSANTDSNVLNVGSTAITFTNTTLTLNLQGGSIIGDGTQYLLINGDSGVAYSGLTTMSNGLGQMVITSGLTLTFSNSLSNTYYAGSYLFVTSDGQDVKVEVVPEPSTWALMLGGLAVLLCLQRRRRDARH